LHKSVEEEFDIVEVEEDIAIINVGYNESEGAIIVISGFASGLAKCGTKGKFFVDLGEYFIQNNCSKYW
jgi:hypothetical protein